MKKKLVIVGNKPNPNNIAKTIDSFDLVCRSGRCENYSENRSGTKTDWLCCEPNYLFMMYMKHDKYNRNKYTQIISNTKNLLMNEVHFNKNKEQIYDCNLYTEDLLNRMVLIDWQKFFNEHNYPFNASVWPFTVFNLICWCIDKFKDEYDIYLANTDIDGSHDAPVNKLWPPHQKAIPICHKFYEDWLADGTIKMVV